MTIKQTKEKVDKEEKKTNCCQPEEGHHLLVAQADYDDAVLPGDSATHALLDSEDEDN
jgi:hypothetical protein